MLCGEVLDGDPPEYLFLFWKHMMQMAQSLAVMQAVRATVRRCGLRIIMVAF